MLQNLLSRSPVLVAVISLECYGTHYTTTHLSVMLSALLVDVV